MEARASAGNPVALLQKKEVQMELKLTRTQIQQLWPLHNNFNNAMKREMAEEMRRGGADPHRLLDPDELRRKLEEWLLKKGTKRGEELATELLKLKAGQVKRLKEISLQLRGPQAYTDAEVAKALALSDAQKDKIQAICSDEEKKMKDIVARERNWFGGSSSAAEWKARQSLQKETNDKAAAILTDAQKKTWQDLTGKPFEVISAFPK
jgi:hypothetical protein